MNDLNLLPDRNRSICFANETRCNADEAANPSRWPVSSGHMWVQGAAQDHTRSHPPSSQLSVPGPGWGASGGSCSPGVGVCVCVCVCVCRCWCWWWWPGRRSDEPCGAIYVSTVPGTDRAGGPMRTSRHIEVVKSKPKGRRCPVLVWITSCTNSWSLAKKKKKKKRERKKKNLKKWRPGQRRERNCIRAGAPPLSMWLFNDVAAGAPGLRMEPSEAPLACLHLSLRSWRWVLCALLRFTRSCSLCRGCWNPPREEQQQQRRRRRRQQQQQEEDRIPSSLCFTIQSPEHPQLLLFHPSKNKTKNTRFHAHRPGFPWGDAWSPLIMARNTLTDCSRRFGAAAGLRCLTVAAREARQAGRFTGLMLACPSGSLCVCLFVVGVFLCCVKES